MACENCFNVCYLQDAAITARAYRDATDDDIAGFAKVVTEVGSHELNEEIRAYGLRAAVAARSEEGKPLIENLLEVAPSIAATYKKIQEACTERLNTLAIIEAELRAACPGTDDGDDRIEEFGQIVRPCYSPNFAAKLAVVAMISEDTQTDI